MEEEQQSGCFIVTFLKGPHSLVSFHIFVFHPKLMFLCKNFCFVPEGRASSPGEESVVPLVTSQRALVRTCFLTNRAAGNPVLLEISLKGTFFFARRAFFFFFWNRWSRDISVFSRLGSTSTCFFCFLRAFRSLSRIIPLFAALTQASHSLQSAAVSSALSPPTISEWTTRTCATRGWCLAGRSWQKSSSGVHPYAPTHSTRRECRLIFLLGGLELKRRERSARTDRALFFTVKGQGQHPEAALVISHVATFLSFLN